MGVASDIGVLLGLSTSCSAVFELHFFLGGGVSNNCSCFKEFFELTGLLGFDSVMNILQISVDLQEKKVILHSFENSGITFSDLHMVD